MLGGGGARCGNDVNACEHKSDGEWWEPHGVRFLQMSYIGTRRRESTRRSGKLKVKGDEFLTAPCIGDNRRLDGEALVH